ncbi:hypothetical protein FI667_g6978, partial [Globisporangium splendens]
MEAIAVSARETRSNTLIECIKRLHQHHPSAIQSGLDPIGSSSSAAHTSDSALTIHLVGADHREGNTGAETCVIFDTFFRALAEERRFATLQLVLVGPNIARLLHRSSYSHLWTSALGDENVDTTTRNAANPSTCQIEISYFVGSFDDYFLDKALYLPPDLAVCFNAGIWGYDEWLPSLRLLLHTIKTPLLVTSYNENEAMDDEDVLDTLAPPQWFWRAEKNPHGSLRHRATNNDFGSILKENDYWMCLGPETAAAK